MTEGSPPHTRGKGGSFAHAINVGRITPAHAGKSLQLRQKARLSRDHPRTRGEKSLCETAILFYQGSPPHTRGKDNPNKTRVPSFRITPAHAGKSENYPVISGYIWDHPRTRGEKFYFKPGHKFNLWITPAHAGKSASVPGEQFSPSDHPRTRGEK